MRTVNSLTHSIHELKWGHLKESTYQFLHAALGACAVGLYFFNPVLTYLTSTLSDSISDLKNFFSQVQAGNIRGALESGGSLILDLLFISSIAYGAIEITVATLGLQILIDFYHSVGFFRKGALIEGILQAILGAAHIRQIIPQAKVLQWKWERKPELVAELKRSEQGFVYLDLPDEYLYEIFKTQGKGEIPPYFGKGKAGAHISVMIKGELPKDIPIKELGKKYKFRIVQVDQAGSNGEIYYFLTVACPELASLRESYGLSPRINGDHDFHFTFGYKKPNVKPLYNPI